MSVNREIGWLLENGKQGSELRYMTMDDGLIVWTASHMEALRFSRRVDAERFLGDCSEDVRVSEHVWMSLDGYEAQALDTDLASDARAAGAVDNPMLKANETGGA